MDRAIDIKRRAQRAIQSGDLDGALAAYEKLIASDESDPYNFILLADLLYKKGDLETASKRYLTAAECYEKAGLYKNAIAVGKKMLRLGLSPAAVLDRLAKLHALDGLTTEATLYYTQLAEHLMRENKTSDAATALRRAFDCSTENIKALERLAEVHTIADDVPAAAQAFAEAATHYRSAGQGANADRCAGQAEELMPGAMAAFEAQSAPPRTVATAEASQGPGHSLTPDDGDALEPGVLHLSAAAPPSGQEMRDRFFDDAAPTDAVDKTPPAPVAASAVPVERHAVEPPAPESVNAGVDEALPTDLKGVERLLGLAQTVFRAGNADRAAEILARAAQGYEAFDRLDNAASIYRSLCSGPHGTTAMLELWLRNCERREEWREAGQVACDLGDRAINGDQLEEARTWFERAASLDPENLVSRRRLERLRPAVTETPVAETLTTETAEEVDEAVAARESGDGRINVAMDRGQAVSFDLAATLAEFQRGVESQLSGDAQAHYDLAMAYREMGLTQQAIEAFRFAATDPGFKLRAAEMIGHCLLSEGRFDEAERELGEALADAALDSGSGVGIRFQLGLALEAAGRSQEALAQFEQVFEIQASYPDVAQKIRGLRKIQEAA